MMADAPKRRVVVDWYWHWSVASATLRRDRFPTRSTWYHPFPDEFAELGIKPKCAAFQMSEEDSWKHIPQRRPTDFVRNQRQALYIAMDRAIQIFD
jgi:hypothetical protein